jgi:hypothetical protein
MFFDSQVFLITDFRSDCSRSSISPVFVKVSRSSSLALCSFRQQVQFSVHLPFVWTSLEGFHELIAALRFASNFTSSSTAIAWLLCKGMVDNFSSDRKWFLLRHLFDYVEFDLMYLVPFCCSRLNSDLLFTDAGIVTLDSQRMVKCRSTLYVINSNSVKHISLRVLTNALYSFILLHQTC